MKKLIIAGLVGLFIGMSFSGCFIGSFAAVYFKNLNTKVESAVTQKSDDIKTANSEIKEQDKPVIQQAELIAKQEQAKDITQPKISTTTKNATTTSSSSKKTNVTKPTVDNAAISNELTSITKKFANVLYNTNPENIDNNFKTLNSMAIPAGFTGTKEETDYLYKDILDDTLVLKSMNIKSIVISSVYDSAAKKSNLAATVFLDIKYLKDDIEITEQSQLGFILDNSSGAWKICRYFWENI